MLTLCIMPNFVGTSKEKLQALISTVGLDTVIIIGCM